MRTKIITLEAFEDENFGLIGLGVKGMPRGENTNVATTGLLIAHDLLEHQNGIELMGTIDDELEALGGIWFVRGQWGDLNRDGTGAYYTIHENIGSDISRMFRDFFYGAPVNTSPLRTRPCDEDADFEEIIRCAVKDMPGEVEEDVKDEAELAEKVRLYTAICLPRMRIGFRKAQRKWRQYRPVLANTLFWEIAGAVDPCCKHAEVEGQEFELRFGIDKDGRAWAKCYEKGMEDY